MAANSLKSAFIGIVKISLAGLFNYLFGLMLVLSDNWFAVKDGFSFTHLSAGVSFLTILLLGALGAGASFIAVALQPTQLASDSTQLILLIEIMICSAVQYAAVKLSILYCGLSTDLNGITRKQLFLTSLVFSAVYTLSNYYLLRKGLSVSLLHLAVADALGILSLILIIYLANKLRKFF